MRNIDEVDTLAAMAQDGSMAAAMEVTSLMGIC